MTQAALLAGLLKAPSRYAPTRSVELASARVDVVLDNMVEAGFLSPSAEAEPPRSSRLRLSHLRRRDGLSLCRRLGGGDCLPEFVGKHEGDLVVETTIDAGLQRARS